MTCTEIKNKKYQTRKSSFHAGHCKNLTKKRKDAKFYYIHNNGGRRFRVEVSGKTVKIYHGSPEKLPDGTIDYDTMEYNDLVKKLTVKEIYVGQSPCIPAADACGAFAKGNTLLLHVSHNTYMYVGETIYEFTMDDKVDKYYSLIGNNDAPYPVLLGTKNVYFMLDHEMMPREAFKANMTEAEWADAYQYYFGFKDLETGEKIKCDQSALKKRKECIQARGEKAKRMSTTYIRKMKGVRIIQVTV